VELLARSNDAPLLGDHPEVEEVVIVEPFHGRRYIDFFEIYWLNFPIVDIASRRLRRMGRPDETTYFSISGGETSE
jgi:hypothetical protein